MSQLGKSVLIKVGKREVICRELTVAGVRQLIQGQPTADLVNEVLFEDVRLADLEVLTDLTMADVDGMLPSDLRTIVDACKEANPDFFAMLARLYKQRPAA